MNNQEISRKYNCLLKEYDDIYRHVAKHFHMSESEFWILYILFTEQTQPTQRELCLRLHAPKQTIHSALRKMEQAEWIHYIALKDHRMKQIALCEKGYQAALSTVALITAKEESAFQCFSDEEKSNFISLLERYVIHLKDSMKAYSVD